MTENNVIEDFLEHTDTTAGPPPTPFPTIGLARTVAGLCEAYRRLPTGAPLLIVRTVRRANTPSGRVKTPGVRTPQPVPRILTAISLAVKPNDAEAYGDGGISFPVVQRGECEQNQVSAVRGPITIGIGELAETTEVVFGEEGIHVWVSNDRNEPPTVAWLDPKQTAAVRLFRTADVINYVVQSANLVKLREHIGELIGQKIQSLSNLARIKESKPETIAWARRIVFDLSRLGYDDQIVSQGLERIRKRETAEFMRLVNAPSR